MCREFSLQIVCDNCSKYKANLSYNNTVKRVCYVCHRKLNIDKIQETDSYILKKTTIDRVARDPKRRRSTMVSEVNGDLVWKPPGKGWHKGWFAISDLVLFAHKGKKVHNLINYFSAAPLLIMLTFNISLLIPPLMCKELFLLELKKALVTSYSQVL